MTHLFDSHSLRLFRQRVPSPVARISWHLLAFEVIAVCSALYWNFSLPDAQRFDWVDLLIAKSLVWQIFGTAAWGIAAVTFRWPLAGAKRLRSAVALLLASLLFIVSYGVAYIAVLQFVYIGRLTLQWTESYAGVFLDLHAVFFYLLFWVLVAGEQFIGSAVIAGQKREMLRQSLYDSAPVRPDRPVTSGPILIEFIGAITSRIARYHEQVMAGRESAALAIEPRYKAIVSEQGGDSGRPIERVVVNDRGRLISIPTTDIRWIEAQQHYIEFHTVRGTYLYRATMAQLEQELPSTFVRIHRSYMVNTRHVESVKTSNRGDYLVTIKDGQELSVSRRRRDVLGQILARVNSRDSD